MLFNDSLRFEIGVIISLVTVSLYCLAALLCHDSGIIFSTLFILSNELLIVVTLFVNVAISPSIPE